MPSSARYELLLMRHGQAEDHAPGGDAERRLTAAGRVQADEIGAALARLGRVPDVVVCSPFVRARETADLVAAGAGAQGVPLVREPMLVPGAPVATAIQRITDLATTTTSAGRPPRVLAVGHNPSVTAVLGQLVCGDPGIHFAVATADLAHVFVENGRAVLLAYLPSAALTRLLRA